MSVSVKCYRVLLLAVLLFSLACEDVVNVNLTPQNLNLIAVEAYINTQPSNNILVKLERTVPVNSQGNNPPINNALVQISDNQESPAKVTLYERGNSGLYTLPPNVSYQAVPGRTYSLWILLDDGTEITGSEYLTPCPKLDTVKVNLSPRGDYKYPGVFISTQDPPLLGNCYKWDIYINGQLLFGGQDLAIAEDELFNGNYISDLLIFMDWDDTDDKQIIEVGDTIMVEQLSISKAAYDFYYSMRDQAWTGSPFSVPPANIASNLRTNNGKRVLGLFSARDQSRSAPIPVTEDNMVPLQNAYSPN